MIGDYVKIVVGSYRGMTARVVDRAPTIGKVTVAFATGYRISYWEREVEVINS